MTRRISRAAAERDADVLDSIITMRRPSTKSALQDHTGRDLHEVQIALQSLRRYGLIEPVGSKGHGGWRPTPDGLTAHRDGIEVKESPEDRVAAALEAGPKIGRTIRQETGMGRTLTYRAIRALVKAGTVERRGCWYALTA